MSKIAAKISLVKIEVEIKYSLIFLWHIVLKYERNSMESFPYFFVNDIF